MFKNVIHYILMFIGSLVALLFIMNLFSPDKVNFVILLSVFILIFILIYSVVLLLFWLTIYIYNQFFGLSKNLTNRHKTICKAIAFSILSVMAIQSINNIKIYDIFLIFTGLILFIIYLNRK